MSAPSPRPETCVGAVVLDEGRLLLIRRGRGTARGLWSVPGGRVEWGETLAQAVEREVVEETGLRVVCGRYLGWVELIGDGYHYVVHDFLAHRAEGPTGPGELRAGDDADDAAWVPLDRLGSVPLVEGLHRFLFEHGVAGPPEA